VGKVSQTPIGKARNLARQLACRNPRVPKSAAENNKGMHEALLRLVPDRTEQIMGWLTQPYYDKGKAEGEAKGEAKILTRLLERRFGTLPGSLRQQIFAADAGSIEAWVERAFDAPDLQSIFGSI
jgi:hypothetical protein